MAENESENTLNQNAPGHNDASKTTVPPVRDPMSLRDTDTGNLKRLTPGQAKKTIKLKPLTAKSTTTLPTADSAEEGTEVQQSASATGAAPSPLIKLKPVAAPAAPSPLTAKSSAATIKITPKMKTGAEEEGPQTQAEAKPVSSGSAVLRPAASATTGGLKPVVSAADAAPGLKLSAVKPGATAGLKPVSSGSAVLRPVASATTGGLKPVMPGATASGLKPVIKSATASGLKPVVPAGEAAKPGLSLAKPKPIETPAPEAAAPEASAPEAVVPEVAAPAAAPRKLSISKPAAPAKEPEAESAVGGDLKEDKPLMTLASNKSSGPLATAGNTAGLKLKGDEEKAQAEKEQFESELKDIKGGVDEIASGAKIEPGIVLSLCNIAAMITLICTLTLVTVQFLNQWHGKDIKLPGLENIADKPLLVKTPPVETVSAVTAKK